MRFPADDIWKVRLGERTRITIPYERRPAPWQEGNFYVLEREMDISEEKPCGRCGGTGQAKKGTCVPCGGHGTRVVYSTKAERVEGEERVQILSRSKLAVSDIRDDQALEEGYESADEFRDAFFATYGECDLCWTFTFELTKQVPQYMAIQQGQVDPQQYVTTPARALDDADAPSGEQYREWAAKAEAEVRRQREAKRLRERARKLNEQADKLDAEAA